MRGVEGSGERRWFVDGQNNRNLWKASKIMARINVRTATEISTSMTARGVGLARMEWLDDCPAARPRYKPTWTCLRQPNCLGGDF